MPSGQSARPTTLVCGWAHHALPSFPMLRLGRLCSPNGRSGQPTSRYSPPPTRLPGVLDLCPPVPRLRRCSLSASKPHKHTASPPFGHRRSCGSWQQWCPLPRPASAPRGSSKRTSCQRSARWSPPSFTRCPGSSVTDPSATSLTLLNSRTLVSSSVMRARGSPPGRRRLRATPPIWRSTFAAPTFPMNSSRLDSFVKRSLALPRVDSQHRTKWCCPAQLASKLSQCSIATLRPAGCNFSRSSMTRTASVRRRFGEPSRAQAGSDGLRSDDRAHRSKRWRRDFTHPALTSGVGMTTPSRNCLPRRTVRPNPLRFQSFAK